MSRDVKGPDEPNEMTRGGGYKYLPQRMTTRGRRELYGLELAIFGPVEPEVGYVGRRVG